MNIYKTILCSTVAFSTVLGSAGVSVFASTPSTTPTAIKSTTVTTQMNKTDLNTLVRLGIAVPNSTKVTKTGVISIVRAPQYSTDKNYGYIPSPMQQEYTAYLKADDGNTYKLEAKDLSIYYDNFSSIKGISTNSMYLALDGKYATITGNLINYTYNATKDVKGTYKTTFNTLIAGYNKCKTINVTDATKTIYKTDLSNLQQLGIAVPKSTKVTKTGIITVVKEPQYVIDKNYGAIPSPMQQEYSVYLKTDDGSNYKLEAPNLSTLFYGFSSSKLVSQEMIYDAINGKTLTITGSLIDYTYNAKKDATGKYKATFDSLIAEYNKCKTIKITGASKAIYKVDLNTLVKLGVATTVSTNVTKSGELSIVPLPDYQIDSINYGIIPSPMNLKYNVYLKTSDGVYKLDTSQIVTILQNKLTQSGTTIVSPESVLTSISGKQVTITGRLIDYKYNASKDAHSKYQATFDSLISAYNKCKTIQVIDANMVIAETLK